MDLVNHLENRLLFAVPKKGRLQDRTLDLLHGSDIHFKQAHRLDIALVQNLPIALVFLPAADIPTFVGEGLVDLGITGRDQCAEHDAALSPDSQPRWEEVLDLEFGDCKLQVQVPEKSGLTSVEELVGKAVATSFTHLTKALFAKLERKSDQDSATDEGSQTATKLKTKVTYIGGSVETACALGVADGIVDLVESGETMKAAGLKAIGTVIESTAILIKSKRTSNPSLVELIASRIKGVIAAQKYVLCQYNVQRSFLATVTAITPGKRAPTITPLDTDGWVAVSSMVEKKKIATVMDELATVGAQDILVLALSNSRFL
ncbi:MAG: ATP phosphoribosyltransferase (ATP-PRTase) (ATP-PRT) [Phylliscum demangeonii]|nr:MAG: ATP phosphoribosyltransferase (ATP-PRTase) (ATP-PRT) [Phylliscum demangeonii]